MKVPEAASLKAAYDPRLKNIYSRMLGYLKPYRSHFALAMVFMVAFGATDGIIPFLVKEVLDGVFASQNKGLLTLIPIALILFTTLRAIFEFCQQYMMAKLGHWIVRDLRNQVNVHLLKMSPDFFSFRSSADLVTRVTSDVLLLRTLLTDAAAAIIRDSIRVVALVGAAFYLDPVLASIAVIGFPLGVYPVYVFGRRMRKLSRVGQEAIGALSSLMQQTAIGNRVVRIFGREDFEKERFEKENNSLTRTFVKAEKMRALTGPVNEVLASFAIAGVVLYGGYSVIGGIRSQGDFIAFLISVFLLYDPFKKLSRVSGVVQQGVAGSERLFEVLDTPATIKDPVNPIAIPSAYDIVIDNVDFAYKGHPSGEGVAADGQLALEGINLRIGEGQKVALVGFSGAGKSTLVDLIPRFIDPLHGSVRIGGVDISKLGLRPLRDRIAMVGQHTFLFHDTILNNILYGNSTATREQAEQAARAAYAYDFIMQMPHGFDSVVGESGMTLSGGERQRIAIARAILKNAPILILDEATASLDNRSEREVQSALEELEKGRTTIVIAHRLSTVRNADLIVVLREGRIVETGTHEELLSRGGEFAKLYALQFREPEKEQNGEGKEAAVGA